MVEGDRVVGYLPNIPETIVAMLAASTLGAIWSSCSPDFGVRGVLDRFERLEPKLLVCCDGYSYGGKRIDCRPRTAEILEALAKTTTNAPQVVMVPFLDSDATTEVLPDAVRWDDFLQQGEGVPPDLTPAPSPVRTTSCSPVARPDCPSALCNRRGRASESTQRTCLALFVDT